MDEIVALVDALAWPITVLILAYAFRSLLLRITALKWGQLEISLDAYLREAEEKAAALPRSRNQQDVPRIDEVESKVSDVLFRIADRLPRDAVIEAWLEIERAVLEAARASGAIEPERRSVHKLMLDLVRRGLITQEFLDVFNYLKVIRNKVVNQVEAKVDTSESQRYIDLAIDLAVQIKRAGRKLPYNIPLNPDTG